MTQHRDDSGAAKPVPSGDSWTCPDGYAFPRCRCGHNFFEFQPVVRGAHLNYGPCEWCIRDAMTNED